MNFKRYHVSKNLFDKNSAPSVGWYCGSDDIIRSSTAIKATYIPCSPNTTYTIAKVQSARFKVAWTANEPALGVTYYGLTNVSGTSVTVTTGSTASYLYIEYYTSASDTYTEAEIRNTIMLNTGSQPLPYEPYGDTWHDTPHYIHNTSTDTITTLPADIYANDVTATVGLKGDMEQSSQPSPTTPIQPQECGDTSSNLWSYHPDTTSGGVRLLWDGEKIKYSNTCTYASNSIMTIDLKKGTYTLKVNANRIPVENDYSCIDIYHPSSGLLKQVTNRNAVNGKVTFTLDDDLSNVSLRIRLDNGTNYDGFEIRPMLNIGETSLPYDVYGQYKIPILNNSQTTNVYLGEVESTRRIKKLVLNGTENWADAAIQSQKRYLINIADTAKDGSTTRAYCTHYAYEYTTTGTGFSVGSAGTNIYFRDNNYSSVTDWKTYLQQQYTNGTPVTVWYVLATPQTAVVNEPIRKIGDYADTVSGITIPTIAGANTLSIGTTLQPSEVTATYKGWHPASAVHERENGAWD